MVTVYHQVVQVAAENLMSEGIQLKYCHLIQLAMPQIWAKKIARPHDWKDWWGK